MNHKPRTGHPDYITFIEASKLLDVSVQKVEVWMRYLSLYHDSDTLNHDNGISIEGLAALKEYRGDADRYHKNHTIGQHLQPMTRTDLAKVLKCHRRDIANDLKGIEQVHLLEGFFDDKNRLTRLAISCILEFRAIGITEYALKCHVNAA